MPVGVATKNGWPGLPYRSKPVASAVFVTVITWFDTLSMATRYRG